MPTRRRLAVLGALLTFRPGAAPARGGVPPDRARHVGAERPPAARGAPADTATVVAGPTGARIDSALAAAAAAGFHGVALVAKDGRVVLRKGYGLADRAAGTPFGAGTAVAIHSNSKDFTAVAVLQLVERGRLALADSLGRFFPDAPADRRRVTLRQLLDHRGGFPDALGPDSVALTRAEFLRRAWQAPLRFAPGSREGYSNVGYSLLAAVVEAVTATPFDRYVREAILAPLGLRDTGVAPGPWPPARLSHEYLGERDRSTLGGFGVVSDGSSWSGRGNGAMASTVGDMYRFYDALLGSDRLLRPATRAAVFDPTAAVALAGSDQVGFFLYERVPRAGVVLVVATTSSEFRAPRVRELVAPLVGLPSLERRTAASPATPAAGAAPVALPDAPEWVAPKAFLAAHNAATAEAFRTIVAERLVPSDAPADERAARLAESARRFGPVTPVAVVSQAPGELVVRALAPDRRSVRMTFRTETAPPFRIRSVMLEPEG